ncbi:ATP-binding protein [Pseudoroseicyclus sp. H15]
MTVIAAAHPQKRLFISLLTRDIGLADAFLDIIDNSINAALRQLGLADDSSEDYLKMLNEDRVPKHSISINFGSSSVTVSDDCGGISATDAAEKVFIFGASDASHLEDKLSVYGIGLKRAMFKLGNKVRMISDHASGGFDLDLDVAEWEARSEDSWTFEIETRPPAKAGKTKLQIGELYDSVKSRLQSAAFETELANRISHAYSFFLGRVVRVFLNDQELEGGLPSIGSNTAAESFSEYGVSVAISAGLGEPGGSKRYSSETAGWNVFCNGRAVIVADKSVLTGWGVEGLLPSFQPKHRPFVGNVFFTSANPELLPWTTTKLGVNPDNLVWQRSVRRMADIGRQITRFLDSRYQEEGTVITKDELSDAIGESTLLRPSIVLEARTFAAPVRSKSSSLTSIQFKVDKKLLAKVKSAIGRRSMSNAEVGQYLLDYFVESEIDQ